MTSSDKDDDDHNHQQAFMEFMLRGKGFKSPSNSTNRSTNQPIQHPQTDLNNSWKKLHQRQHNQEGSIMKALRGSWEEYKEMDHHLKEIMESIANLRDRIFWESQKVLQLQDNGNSKNNTRITREWNYHGFRGNGSCQPAKGRNDNVSWVICRQDVELALSHDLLQHERMLTSARSVMSSLAQIVDAMGRRLDEWMLLIELNETSKLDEYLQLYTWLGTELYRKQMLVQDVLESCHDGMVHESEEPSENNDPRKISRKCVEEWTFGKDGKEFEDS